MAGKVIKEIEKIRYENIIRNRKLLNSSDNEKICGKNFEVFCSYDQNLNFRSVRIDFDEEKNIIIRQEMPKGMNFSNYSVNNLKPIKIMKDKYFLYEQTTIVSEYEEPEKEFICEIYE